MFSGYGCTSDRLVVQSDPIGLWSGPNTYLYGYADPLYFMDPYGLFGWADMPTLPPEWVDFSAGMGDVILFGQGQTLRDWFGIDGGIDRCSGAYGAGEWAGVAASLATGVAGGVKAAGAKGAGKEFSHWIPNRMGGPRSIWNGNFVTPARHYLQDPYRYPRGWQELGNRFPPWLRQLDRIPNAYKGGAVGAGWGGAGIAMNDDCTCRR